MNKQHIVHLSHFIADISSHKLSHHKGGGKILYGLPCTILEYAFKATRPICKIFNNNRTMP